MYGTVARFRAKPGRGSELKALMDEWDRDFRPKVAGAMAGYLYQTDADPDEYFMCAVFADKDSYMANAESPEQDKWFQRFSELLTSDPEWHDGAIIYGG